MSSVRTSDAWSFWLRWVGATVLGYVVGWTLGFILGHVLLGNVMLGVGVGAGVGFMQWSLIRGLFERPGWWIAYTTVGLAVAVAVHAVVAMIWDYPFDLGWPDGALAWVRTFILGGALIGFLQVRTLRPSVGGIRLWVLASAIGWGLSVVGLAILPEMRLGGRIFAAILRNLVMPATVAGILLGAVTGGALVWLLRRATPGGPA